MKQEITDRIMGWMEQELKDSDCFIVDARFDANNAIKFFVDCDLGINIDKTAKLNRALRDFIDSEELFPEGNYLLEISSPGIDTPLKLPRQYKKNVGKKVKIVTNENEIIEGRLIAFEEDILTVEKKVKKEISNINLKLEDIKQTLIQIEFK